MFKLDIIDNNKYYNNFYLEKYFYQLVVVNNQDIINGKVEIE